MKENTQQTNRSPTATLAYQSCRFYYSKMASSADCSDDSFGPWAGSSCRGGLDFTLAFEQTILTIAPATLFLLLIAPRLLFLLGEAPKTVKNTTRYIKTVSNVPSIAWGTPHC